MPISYMHPETILMRNLRWECFSVFVPYLVLTVTSLLLILQILLPSVRCWLTFMLLLFYYYYINLFTWSLILQAGMHIYARAASRGKRVQVNTLIFFPSPPLGVSIVVRPI